MKNKLTKTLIRIERKYDALLEEMNSENEGGMVDVALVCELVDSVPFLIDQILELERVNKQLKNNLSVYKGYYKNTLKINKDVIEENKKYRRLIKDMGQEIEVLTDVMSNADNADELNYEAIRLKGVLENER